MSDQSKALRSLSFNANLPHEVRTLAEAVNGLSISVDGSQNGHRELSVRIAMIESRLMHLEQQLQRNQASSLIQ
jgi:hypothetical protein